MASVAEPRPLQERLDEIVINKHFDVAAALSAIQFYWNLARHRGEPVVVEIWGARKKEVLCEAPQNGKAHEAQETAV